MQLLLLHNSSWGGYAAGGCIAGDSEGLPRRPRSGPADARYSMPLRRPRFRRGSVNSCRLHAAYARKTIEQTCRSVALR